MAASIVLASERRWLAVASVALLWACDLNQSTGEATLPAPADASIAADTADIAPVAKGKLQISPEPIDFGGQLLGTCNTRTATLRNIGDAPLVISGLDLQMLSPQLAVKWLSPQSMAGQSKAGGQNWGLTTPVSLAPNQAAGIALEYCRTDAAAMVGTLSVATDAGASNLTVGAKEVKNEGPVDPPVCPIALAKVAEGSEVMVDTTLHLSSSGSKSPAGTAIAKFEWAVSQPAGSNQALSPGGSAPDVSLVAATVGPYSFCLSVWDAKGVKSCTPSCVEVLVVPGNEVSAGLTWQTPNAKGTDGSPGADLDLHFAHPMAKGLDRDCDGVGDPWFSNPWDAFWYNLKPTWTTPGSPTDPTLSGDDKAGVIGETLSLTKSEGTLNDPVAYTVGVHYWNDHDLGQSKANLKIWAQGVLVMNLADVELEPGDMWTVGRLHWPNNLSGGSKAPFEPCKQQGKTCAGGKTKMWQGSGQWCIAPCYKDNAFTSAATKPMVECEK